MNGWKLYHWTECLHVIYSSHLFKTPATNLAFSLSRVPSAFVFTLKTHLVDTSFWSGDEGMICHVFFVFKALNSTPMVLYHSRLARANLCVFGAIDKAGAVVVDAGTLLVTMDRTFGVEWPVLDLVCMWWVLFMEVCVEDVGEAWAEAVGEFEWFGGLLEAAVVSELVDE